MSLYPGDRGGVHSLGGGGPVGGAAVVLRDRPVAPRAVVADAATGSCADTVRSILDTALLAEQLAVAFYYGGLTSPAVLRTGGLGGASADPNNPGLPPSGNPHHVRYLQAALDAEAKHAAQLIQAGATARHTHFYFPAGIFSRRGTSVSPNSFLGLLERLESLQVSLYTTASAQFLHLRRPDLAVQAAQIMGVEAEHRSLGRIIAAILPPNNLTLESPPMACVAEAEAALQPFLTGRRYLFASDATHATALPSPAQIARVVGKYGTRRLKRFL